MMACMTTSPLAMHAGCECKCSGRESTSSKGTVSLVMSYCMHTVTVSHIPNVAEWELTLEDVAECQ